MKTYKWKDIKNKPKLLHTTEREVGLVRPIPFLTNLRYLIGYLASEEWLWWYAIALVSGALVGVACW